METISKMLVAMLCMTMLCGITTAPTHATENNNIIPYNTVTNITPALTFNIKTSPGTDGINQILETKDFKDFLTQHGIANTDYRIEMVSPESTEPNLIMLTDNTNKWYYKVSNGNSREINKQTSPNYFTIHNSCGRTVYYIGVTLYRWIGTYPVDVHRITNWNLNADGVLHLIQIQIIPM